MALQEKDVTRLKVLRRFREILAEVLALPGMEVNRSFEEKNRRLTLGDYLSLLLLALFHPIARTLRGLVQASHLPNVQRGVCSQPTSLGSLSEAQHLVEPELLEKVLSHLFGQLPKVAPRCKALEGSQRWLAQDSTLLAALPRMAWALYGCGRTGDSHAVRMNLSFDLQKDAPAKAKIARGKSCERAALKEMIQPGCGYVGDRYYGEHYAFFTWLSVQNCAYVIRLLDRGTEPLVEEELPVTPEDAAQGVFRQAWVRLGKEERGTLSERLRLIWLHGQKDEELLLVTNLTPEELSAADAALLYKERWQIEYFFRWLKCLLGENQWHWLAESPRGVAIQLYLNLIAAVLLQLDFGRRPSKRVWELLRWYLCGMVDEETLALLLAKQLAHEAALRAQRAAKKAKSAR